MQSSLQVVRHLFRFDEQLKSVSSKINKSIGLYQTFQGFFPRTTYKQFINHLPDLMLWQYKTRF